MLAHASFALCVSSAVHDDAATLVDVIGTAALVTQSDIGGVSLSITTHYLDPIPRGQEVEVHARVVKAGKQIATITVELRQPGGQRVVAQGTHVKALVATSDLSSLLNRTQDGRHPDQNGLLRSRL